MVETLVLPPPSHDSNQGRGGLHSVAMLSDLSKIPSNLLKDRMVVSVAEGDSLWLLKGNTWVKLIEAGILGRVLLIEEDMETRLSEAELIKLIKRVAGDGGGTDPDPGEGTLVVFQSEDGTDWETEDGEPFETENSTYNP